MSQTSMKARIVLLDENTGKPIGECEIISDSKEIFYSNEVPMPGNVGNIPAGTTFDKTSLSDILDGILYNKENPYFSNDGFTLSNGDVINGIDDKIIFKPSGTTVYPFSITIAAYYGSYDNITITLHKLANGVDNHIEKYYSRSDKNTSKVIVTFGVGSFSSDTNIWITITTGTNIVSSPIIQYKFVSPIWVGWIRGDILNSDGELDKEITENYFQELIDHQSDKLEKRFVYKSDQPSYVMSGLNYSTREQLNPCIIIPQSWGELDKITDMNGNNIIKSYAKYVGISINTYNNNLEYYIAYVSRQTCANDWDFIRGVTYIANSSNKINTDNFFGNGIPSNIGFAMLNNVPIDDRYHVKTYDNLLKMVYPYPGLITYVEEINTSFRYEKSHWVPFNNKTHVIESINELTEDLGGWDDLAINAMDGKIWKKRYNNQWERYGDIKAEDGKVTFELNKGDE